MGYQIKISSAWKPEAGKLVPDEKQRKKKQAVCDRFPKRSKKITYGKKASSCVNRTP